MVPDMDSIIENKTIYRAHAMHRNPKKKKSTPRLNTRIKIVYTTQKCRKHFSRWITAKFIERIIIIIIVQIANAEQHSATQNWKKIEQFCVNFVFVVFTLFLESIMNLWICYLYYGNNSRLLMAKKYY